MFYLILFEFLDDDVCAKLSKFCCLHYTTRKMSKIKKLSHIYLKISKYAFWLLNCHFSRSVNPSKTHKRHRSDPVAHETRGDPDIMLLTKNLLISCILS